MFWLRNRTLVYGLGIVFYFVLINFFILLCIITLTAFKRLFFCEQYSINKEFPIIFTLKLEFYDGISLEFSIIWVDTSVAPNLPTIEDSMINRTDSVHTLSRLFLGAFFLFV